MMTALVAALGLLPAALATGVGTDSQRPFALVIVSGLFTRLLISVFLMPALYALVARPDDRLEVKQRGAGRAPSARKALEGERRVSAQSVCGRRVRSELAEQVERYRGTRASRPAARASAAGRRHSRQAAVGADDPVAG